MSSLKRDFALLGSFGALLLLTTHCSELTKVDWSLVPPEGANGGAAGDSSLAGAGAGGSPDAGQAGEAGDATGTGVSGEGGEGGSAGDPEAGFGGTLGGTGGTVGGTGGALVTAGSGGTPAVGGAQGHPTCSVAPTLPATPPNLSGSIVFFNGGTGTSGDRKGRTGLRTSCQTAKAALGLPQQATEAVISVSVADQILEMPENYGIPRTSPHVVSPLGIEIAPSWNDVWRALSVPSLVCTGVMPPTVTRWLTGTSGSAKSTIPSDPNPANTYYGLWEYSADMGGNQFNNSCNGWTLADFDLGIKARVGSTIADHDAGADGHPRLIDYLALDCNTATYNVLCVAFDPLP